MKVPISTYLPANALFCIFHFALCILHWNKVRYERFEAEEKPGGMESAAAPRALECFLNPAHYPGVDRCFRLPAHVPDQELQRALWSATRTPAKAF